MIAVDTHPLHHGLPTTKGMQSPGEKMKPPVAANLAAARLARIFPTLERRVRARGLQPGGAPVGRVPSRGARLAFPSEGELSGLGVVRENVTA